MAIISEEPDHNNSKPRLRKPKPNSEPKPSPEPTQTKSTTNPFQFWFYFTLTVSLITLFFIILSSFSSQDPKSWFLDLPPVLRTHYSNGKIIKVQTAPNLPQVEVFSIQKGPINSDSHVLIIHGLGCSSFAFRNVVNLLGLKKNVHVVAIDLPGSGFSDKTVTVVEESVVGNNGLWGVYEDIKEKGLFWGFDQLVEQGYVNVEENVGRVSTKERVRSVEMGSEEIGRVLGQVVDSLGLVPVDLVLHDSALGLCGNWIAENRGLVRSVVILDGVGVGTVFPGWVLEMPVVRNVVLGFGFLFERVLGKCCVGLDGGSVEADGHRILLKGRDGVSSVVEMGKRMNSSFDLLEWSRLDGVKDLPMRVVWSGGWSEEWTSEGRRVSDALPQATLVTHSGGRWIQENNSEEVAESIHEFVSSLPKPSKRVIEEPLPEHIQEMLHNAERSDQHKHHHPGHGGHGHDNHGHAHAGYPDAYGLDHGWGI